MPEDTKSGFWSPATLRNRLPHLVSPSSEHRIKQGAIELRMGREAFVTGGGGRIALPEKTGDVVIPPGQFALLLTEERITIPADAIGLISIKFGLKARGLVNVSGFHVDPGFCGWLTFSVYNAGPREVTISRGKEAFMIWYASWDSQLAATELYSASNNTGRGQQEKLDDDLIMNLQGEIASPGALRADIDKLRTDFTTLTASHSTLKTVFTITITACISVVVAVVGWWVTSRNNQQPPLQNQAPAATQIAAPPTSPAVGSSTALQSKP